VGTLHARPDLGSLNSPWHPETNFEREQTREQLNRLLSSPLFCHSKRYPSLLRYVVERSLDGQTEHLKERTLGVEVFGRNPDYDTNLDPVVRITAVEIRKRIAQYYREAGHEAEMRIDLPAGSYVAEFRRAAPEPTERRAVTSGVLQPSLLPVPTLPGKAVSRQMALRLTALGLVIAGAAAAVVAVRSARNPLDEFWGPMLKAPGTVLLAMGGRQSDLHGANLPEMTINDLMRADQVALSDATTMSMLTGLFTARQKPFRIRRASKMALADLREGPVVLIGAFNNPWSLRLMEPMRFHLDGQPRRGGAILDRQNPSHRWAVDSSTTVASLQEDYALVSRVLDPTTGRLVMMAGGITRYGTSAAGEFLTDPSYLAEMLRAAPKGWNGNSFQVVLATKVVGENSGPPRILATYFW
jgi:hypothetical protein